MKKQQKTSNKMEITSAEFVISNTDVKNAPAEHSPNMPSSDVPTLEIQPHQHADGT